MLVVSLAYIGRLLTHPFAKLAGRQESNDKPLKMDKLQNSPS